MAHVWIEHKYEVKLIVRLADEEAENLRKVLLMATNNLVLSPEQHMIAQTMASAMEAPECPSR